MIKISAVIITNNESARIERTIRALKWCDEIVVTDSGSTDNTPDICKQLGCRVFYHTFKSYGDQKKYAFDQAVNDWILSVDADEVVTPVLEEEIIKIFDNENIEFQGFMIPVRLVFMKRIFQFGRECNALHLRLFNRQYTNINNPDIHEKLVTSGKTGKFKNYLLHYSYNDLGHYFEKFNEYTNKAADELSNRKKSIYKATIFIRFPFNFFKFYFLHRNFMNGFEGLVWSWLCSIYPVVKYLKAYELLKMGRK